MRRIVLVHQATQALDNVMMHLAATSPERIAGVLTRSRITGIPHNLTQNPLAKYVESQIPWVLHSYGRTVCLSGVKSDRERTVVTYEAIEKMSPIFIVRFHKIETMTGVREFVENYEQGMYPHLIDEDNAFGGSE